MEMATHTNLFEAQDPPKYYRPQLTNNAPVYDFRQTKHNQSYTVLHKYQGVLLAGTSNGSVVSVYPDLYYQDMINLNTEIDENGYPVIKPNSTHIPR